jgi:glycosyltransferase involved in cell wall biosynthesis
MLSTAVRSVLDQEGVDVRVLIIDDASKDGSADTARELATQDRRIEVHEHAENRGHIATFNEGVMDWASADYTVLMSADDALTPGALRRATALMEADPEVAFTYGTAISWHGELPLPPARTSPSAATVWSGEAWLRRRFEMGMNCVSSPAAVSRTSVQKAVGGYDPKLLHTSDLEMWMRLSLHGKVGYITGSDQAYVRGHAVNMSTVYEDVDGGVGDLRMRLLAFTTLLAKAGDRVTDATSLDTTVRRRLASDALMRVNRSYDRGTYDEAVAEGLIGFAHETVDDLRVLPAWHALALRRRIGRRTMPYLRPLVLTAVARRGRQIWRERRLVARGV